MLGTLSSPKPEAIWLLILRLASGLCFAGWTWVHFYWEGPYGILLWHDTTYAAAEWFGFSWDDFVGSGANDGLVQTWVARIGWLYLACTILSFTVRRRAWIQMTALVGGSGLLGVLGYAQYLAAQNELPMLVEQGGQVLCPLILVLALAVGPRHRATIALAMVAVILTFIGHGSYALGLWSTPGNFYAMITVILDVNHETTKMILRVAGVLDVLVCIGICIPAVRRPAALYAFFWGLLTSLARPMAGMDSSLHYWGADQFIHEAVLRAPHFLIPLYLFLVWRRPKKEIMSEEASASADG